MKQKKEEKMATLELQEQQLKCDQAAFTKVGRHVSRFRQFATALLVIADLSSVVLAVLCSRVVYQWMHLGRQLRYSPTATLWVAVVFAAAVVVRLEAEGAYEMGDGLMALRETERAMRVTFQCGVGFLAVGFGLSTLFSRWLVVIAVPLSAAALIVTKAVFRHVLRQLHRRGVGIRRVVVYGAGYTGRRVVSALFRSSKAGLWPVAVLDDNPELEGSEIAEIGYWRDNRVQVELGPPTQQTLRRLSADILIAAIPSLREEGVQEILTQTQAAGLQFAMVPHYVPTDYWADFADIDGLRLSFVGRPPSAPFLYETIKRITDFIFSASMLLALSPLLIVIAILIRLDSPGPILFVQERIGKGGRPFKVLKFRTMKTSAPANSFSPIDPNDERITRFGRWLRRSSLDELPQLFNVFKGEMSLVGPRPEMAFIVAGYGARERQRLVVLPGITGLWQLSADRSCLIHHNLHYDLYYIRNRNFFLDIAVLIHTVFFAVRGV